MNRTRIHTPIAAAVALALATIGCSSPASPGGGTTSPATAGADATTPAATGAASAATPSTPPAGSGKPVVDLVLSGTVAVTARGEGGQCILGHGSDGSTSFGWTATEADFAGLGTSFSLQEPPGTDDIDAKWDVRGGVAFFGRLKTGYIFTADHKSVSIDTDLPPSGAATEHVQGTVTCP